MPHSVNPKQYMRILKLREKRLQRGIRPLGRRCKRQMRVLHAQRRPRCANGRFLSKKELEAEDESKRSSGPSSESLSSEQLLSVLS